MEHHEELHLIVVSPESTLFDGKVEMVTLPGEVGSFTVLYDHAPLISSLVRGEIKYREEDELEKSIGISSGFVEVRDNIVSACVEI
ncbi:MAG: ATP synthase F1 subunit epsilon [Bacteroides sp.]|jgi:F-type H+-transporting ATPase subunit epsilon|nr:ATP synthase F1 subunit epsilon [Bacteroides sp.]